MTSNLIYCTSCGTANPAGARFCYKCGALIQVTEPEPPAAPKAETAQPEEPAAEPELAAAPKVETLQPVKPPATPAGLKKKKKATGYVIGGISGVLCLCVVLVIAGSLFYPKLSKSLAARRATPTATATATAAATATMAETATATATATPPPPDPQTALGIALDKFNTAQSYTVHAIYTMETSSGGKSDLDTECLVNMADKTSLTTLKSSSIKQLNYSELEINGDYYKQDATGLYKPGKPRVWSPPFQPSISELSIPSTAFQESTFHYVGEETLGDVQTFKYEMSLTDEQLNNPQSEASVTNPVISLHVGAADGNLVRMDVSFDQLVYRSSGFKYKSQTTTEYSAWNSTTLSVPDYVDIQNTETQTYAGIASSVVIFDFPKVYQLDESLDRPVLYTPAGGQMMFSISPSPVASLSGSSATGWSSDVGQSACQALARSFWLESIQEDDPTASLRKVEWIPQGDLYFCKAVFDTKKGPQAGYTFNEPDEIAKLNKHVFPTNFEITILPGEGEDPETLFWNVISSIQFVKK